MIRLIMIAMRQLALLFVYIGRMGMKISLLAFHSLEAMRYNSLVLVLASLHKQPKADRAECPLDSSTDR